MPLLPVMSLVFESNQWPRGTAAWVSRKGRLFPVVTGGYRNAPLPENLGLMRVRYVSVRDQHRTIEDIPQTCLRSWDDADAHATAARQQPSCNCGPTLIAIVQRVADGEDADKVLASTRGVITGGVMEVPPAAEPVPSDASVALAPSKKHERELAEVLCAFCHEGEDSDDPEEGQHRQSARLRCAPARPLCPPRARLAAQGSWALPE